MDQFRGKALLPKRFVFESILPMLLKDRKYLSMLNFPYRRYIKKYTPDSELPISQISLRVNEVCNLACESCGQWGDNGWLRKKQEDGHRLDQLSFEKVKELIEAGMCVITVGGGGIPVVADEVGRLKGVAAVID